MNHCVIQRNSFAACEEMRGNTTAATAACRSVEMKETVVCPKPRRLSLIQVTLADPSRPLRLHASHNQEFCDAKAGKELLDVILAKGGRGADRSVSPVPSPPPFFSGSPPSRVSNPLIQDARFGDEKFTPISPRAIPTPSGLDSSSPSSARKGGWVRGNYSNNPAVRIEGFYCRDRRNCGIAALA